LIIKLHPPNFGIAIEASKAFREQVYFVVKREEMEI